MDSSFAPQLVEYFKATRPVHAVGLPQVIGKLCFEAPAVLRACAGDLRTIADVPLFVSSSRSIMAVNSL